MRTLKVCRRKINVRVLDNLGFEARCVASPDLPLARLGFYRDATWIDFRISDEFAAEWARAVECDFGLRLHHLTRRSSATAGESECELQCGC